MSGAASSSTMSSLQVFPQKSVNQRPTMALLSFSFDIRIPFSDVSQVTDLSDLRDVQPGRMLRKLRFLPPYRNRRRGSEWTFLIEEEEAGCRPWDVGQKLAGADGPARRRVKCCARNPTCHFFRFTRSRRRVVMGYVPSSWTCSDVLRRVPTPLFPNPLRLRQE